MRRGRRVQVVAAAFLSVSAVIGIGATLPAGAAATLTLGATDGLRDGQAVGFTVAGLEAGPVTGGTVTPGSGVSGTATPSPDATLIPPEVVGSVPGSAPQYQPYVLVTQCAVGRPAYTWCDQPTYTYRPVDGDVRGTYHVSAVLHVPGGSVDCRVEACEVRAGFFRTEQDSVNVAISFDPAAPLLPAPTVTVTPSTDIRPGDLVTVRAEGLRPQQHVWVLQCLGDGVGFDLDRCEQKAGRTAGNPDASSSAEFGVPITASIRVGRYPEPSRTVDCRHAAAGCKVTVVAGSSVIDTPLAFATGAGRPYLDDQYAVDVTRDLTYGRAEGEDGPEDLELDVYVPRDAGPGPRPAVIYVHGGDFAYGGRYEGEEVAQSLAARGYVVISIEYRLYDGHTGIERYAKGIPAAQADAQAAVRWLRANAERYAIEPKAIGIMGYSAGAITALNVAFHSDEPGDSGNPGFPSTVQAAVSLAGGAGNLRGPVPPIRMFHGVEDRVVPYSAGVNTCAAVVAHGQSCELTSYPGLEHDIYARYRDWFPETVEFFAATLVPALDGRLPAVGPEDPAPTSAARPATAVAASPTFTG